MIKKTNAFSTTNSKPILDDAELLRLLFHGKWRLPVLRELLGGPRRLSQLRRAIPQATKKMLIDTLHALNALRWIVRRDYNCRVKRVEYSVVEGIAEHLRRLIGDLVSS
jgi:DNA-binding HxlR family transcriptional regulator